MNVIEFYKVGVLWSGKPQNILKGILLIKCNLLLLFFFSLFYIFFTFEYSSSYIQRRVADLA